ncbi:hypothetical protein ACP70R_033012 [Stipagrostis hirtigluma subsp. patula]
MDARLSPLILLIILVASQLFVGAQPAAHGATPSGLHPVVLLPGYSCSQLDARLTDEYQPPAPGCGLPKQGRRWFRLWENFTALQEDPALLPCYADQLRLVFDPVAGDYRNVPRPVKGAVRGEPLAAPLPRQSKLRIGGRTEPRARVNRTNRGATRDRPRSLDVTRAARLTWC